MALRLPTQITAIIFGIISTFFAIRVLNEPYLWIFPCWGITFLLVALLSQAATVKAIWINSAVAAITLGAVEWYWSAHQNPDPYGRYAGTYTDGYFLKHEFLGFAPPKAATVTAAKIYQDQTLYDVVYHIDQNGLRISPPYQEGARDCLLFFGGSFTFGEGVRDQEAMPYRVGVHSVGRYRIYNFGFHGYGPHQMLSSLQHGLVDRAIECNPKYVIYLGIMDHIRRSAGIVPWEYHGPWYVLEPDGQVRYAGRFDEKPKNRIAERLRLDNSQIYSRIFGKQRAIKPRDIDLYLEIIATTNKILLEHYPESEFHILLWGLETDQFFSHIFNALEQSGINVHPLSRIIPRYRHSPDRYKISPYDDHPNAMGHDLIARYISKNILGK